MDMPKQSSKAAFDLSSEIGPLFFLWLVQLPLPWVRTYLRCSAFLFQFQPHSVMLGSTSTTISKKMGQKGKHAHCFSLNPDLCQAFCGAD
jgi:hypothetical protein